MRNIAIKYWVKFILFLFCLTPIVWFWNRWGSTLINGLDTNFPLDPLIWFQRRLFTWNDSLNAGSDFSSSISGLFFHLVQTIPYVLKFSLQTTEIISLIFWFSLIVTSSYTLAKKIFPNNYLPRLVFVTIFSFNIYLYNSWENVKVSNLSLVAALPLFIAVLDSYKKEPLFLKKLALGSLIASIIASGTGINPAYFLTLVGGMMLFFVSTAIVDRENFKSGLTGLTMSLTILFLVNIFWILPLSHSLFFAKSLRDLSDIGLTNWLDSLSENTSIINVLRLQGAWDWYIFDKDGFPLYIPYALNYFKNGIFIIFSFFLPFTAFVSLAFPDKRKMKWNLFFAVLLVLGVFLTAGSHPPTGEIYMMLNSKIPFFSFFRSPWYIFTPYLLLAFAGLTSILANRLLETDSHKLIGYAAIFVFLTGYIIYSYPLVSGKIFRPGRYDSFYVNFPTYVWSVRDWLANDSRQPDARIVAYPDEELESFSWGYRGTESILGLFSDKEIITPSFNFSNRDLKTLLDKFYKEIKRGNLESAFSILPFMGADTVFLKNDSRSLSTIIDENDTFVSLALDKYRFGKWTLLRSKASFPMKIFSPDVSYFDYDDGKTFPFLSQTLSARSMVLNSGDSEAGKITDLSKKSGILTRAVNITIDKNPIDNIQKHVATIPRSGVYSIFVERKGRASNLDDFQTAKVDACGTDLKFTSNINDLAQFGPQFLQGGSCIITITYPEPESLIQTKDLVSLTGIPPLKKEELPKDTSKTLVLFDSNQKNQKYSLLIPGFDPFHKYALAFDYKYLHGNVPIFGIVQSTQTSVINSIMEPAGSSFDWQHRLISVSPIESESKIELITIVGSNPNAASKTYVENLEFRRIFDNTLFVKEEDTAQIYSPDVTYKKLNPTEYTVELRNVSGPYYIIFLENYSNNWELTSDSVSLNTIHFKANGFANGWYVDGLKPYQYLRISYKPQNLFKIGAGISSLSSLALLLFSAGFFNLNRNIKNEEN